MRRLVSVLVAVALLTAACGGDDAESNSPPATTEDDGGLARFVLAAESVGSIPGFEGAVAQPLGEVQLFENPDPRGPCGGESPAPPVEGTSGRSFTSSQLSLVQVVGEGSEIDAYVDAQLADVSEPCGPYESTVDGESTQTVDEIEVVLLPREFGYFSTAQIQSEGQTAYFGSVVVRVDEVSSLAFVVGPAPIPESSMESLTLLIDAQLRAT